MPFPAKIGDTIYERLPVKFIPHDPDLDFRVVEDSYTYRTLTTQAEVDEWNELVGLSR